jgi:hypothetical protein
MSEKMIFNFEMGRVTVSFVDDDGDEAGGQWKKREFEQEFGLELPPCRHITLDEYNNIFAVIAADNGCDENALKQAILSKRSAIYASIKSKNEELQKAAAAPDPLLERLSEIEEALAFLLGGGQK